MKRLLLCLIMWGLSTAVCPAAELFHVRGSEWGVSKAVVDSRETGTRLGDDPASPDYDDAWCMNYALSGQTFGFMDVTLAYFFDPADGAQKPGWYASRLKAATYVLPVRAVLDDKTRADFDKLLRELTASYGEPDFVVLRDDGLLVTVSAQTPEMAAQLERVQWLSEHELQGRAYWHGDNRDIVADMAGGDCMTEGIIISVFFSSASLNVVGGVW